MSSGNKPSSSHDEQIALFERAVRLHEAGRLDEAENLYLQVHSIDALTNLTVIYMQRQNYEAALGSLERARAMDPHQPEVLNNIGLVLHELKRYGEALAHYDRALALNERYLDPYNNRGVTLEALKRYDDALASYDKALSLAPSVPELHNNRGNVLSKLKRHNEALMSYERAIALRRDYVEAYKSRGDLLRSIGRYDDALKNYDVAIKFRPDYIDAHNNRGATLHDLKRYDAALASYDIALEIDANSAAAWNNRGGTLHWSDRLDEALACFDRALVIQPDYADAHNNRGFILKDMHRYDEALACYDRAIALDPDNPTAYWNMATLKILVGDYEEGWRLHEWRTKLEEPEVKMVKPRHFAQPSWSGSESLEHKTILLHAEQGFGDVIQFCRYALLVEAMGAKVILEVYPPLVQLLSTLSSTLRVIERGAALPVFDYHYPLLSLPFACGTKVDSIPAKIPYLSADAGKRQQWRNRLGEKKRRRIGLVWTGNPDNATNMRRSIPLEDLLALCESDGEYRRDEYHCLQKEISAADRALLEARNIPTYSAQLNDFSDTAALVAEMDIIVTVCTSIAHLAGALGKPTWILLCYSAHFMWFAEREDSPWYPTARLFRQVRWGDWPSAVAKAKMALSTS
ncbi:MAG TPA: tetratricopeptide repeat protein [Rhodocyclaceae bacterium]|nr:tetratricopeptide repeat protein [Rhodocyclaceae bacterium]